MLVLFKRPGTPFTFIGTYLGFGVAAGPNYWKPEQKTLRSKIWKSDRLDVINLIKFLRESQQAVAFSPRNSVPT